MKADGRSTRSKARRNKVETDPKPVIRCSMHQSASEIGAALVRLLIDSVGLGAPHDDVIEISSQLVVRQSTATALSHAVPNR